MVCLYMWVFCEWDEKFKYFVLLFFYKVVNYVEEGVFFVLLRVWEIGKKFLFDVCYLKIIFVIYMYIV